MKRIYPAILLAVASMLVAGMGSAQTSGSMTGTVLMQPCNNNGQIGVTVTGLTPPISYTYSNWQANQQVVHAAVNSVTDNLSGISAYQGLWGNANMWYVAASDGVNSAAASFTLIPAFSFVDSVKPALCPALPTVQATFSGGTPPFSLVWTNVTTSQVYTGNPTTVVPGAYKLMVTDAAGCIVSTSTGSGNINAYSTANFSVGISGTPANCTNGTATVTVSGGTGPFSYLWNNSAVSQTLTGLTKGFYSCVVTDNQGCQSTGWYNLPQAINLNYNSTITHATCLQNNGSIMSFVTGGTGPYSFVWSNAATTQNLSGLPGGQYIAQITDANGCTGTGYAFVNKTTPITVTYSAAASSCTAATGSATLKAVGGQLPYSYLWYSFPNNSTGISISNKTTGHYGFKVTDANGCVQTGQAYIPTVSTLNAALIGPPVVCPQNTGSLSASVQGTHPPFTYLWSNSATTPVLTNVPLGTYNCTITDAAGCKVQKSGAISQISPINVGFNAVPASCVFSSNGVITANATGGQAPYSYLWSNSQTGPSATGLAPGNYYVSVTDANGCKNNYLNSMAYVGYNPNNSTCYCVISGTVYADVNGNCTRDAGEAGIKNIGVHCSGVGYAYTNANGVYQFKVPTGTYTITEIVQPSKYPLAGCQSNGQVRTVTSGAPNCSAIADFANSVIVVHDLQVTNANWSPAVPGNMYSQKVIIFNDGTVNESTAKFGYRHDGQLTFNNCSPWALTQPNASAHPNWYRVNSGFPVINAGVGSAAFIQYNVPTNIPIGTNVVFQDTIAHNSPINTVWLTDQTPWNNVNYHNLTVVGSYDPNFKEVSPQGQGPQGDITSKDSVLTYVVHFQNTGSYFAQNIVVIDTLDSDLRFNSMKPGYSEYRFSTTMSDNGVIKFSFDNINLPWKSSYGDNLSSGMFTYSVRLKKNLPVGTQIKNKAAIYFDYNEPIITNTTINTIVKPTTTVSVQELTEEGANRVLLFPNPAGNYFSLVFRSAEKGAATLKIFDVSGREVAARSVQVESGENSLSENTEKLQSGIYFVQLRNGDVTIEKKLVIAK